MTTSDTRRCCSFHVRISTFLAFPIRTKYWSLKIKALLQRSKRNLTKKIYTTWPSISQFQGLEILPSDFFKYLEILIVGFWGSKIRKCSVGKRLFASKNPCAFATLENLGLEGEKNVIYYLLRTIVAVCVRACWHAESIKKTAGRS